MIESTGRFRARADAAKHLEAGARKVIVSAPAKEPDVTVALGVNFEAYDPEQHHDRLERVVHDELPGAGREGAARIRRHPPRRHDDGARLHRRPDAPRPPAQGLGERARPQLNIVPTSTGAAKAIGLVVPALAGKLHGFAVRVPVPTGSLVDLTIETERPDLGRGDQPALRGACRPRRLEGYPGLQRGAAGLRGLVKSPYSAIFDAPLTTVVDGTQVKVIAWYDNEWGYACRMLEMCEQVLAHAGAAVSG